MEKVNLKEKFSLVDQYWDPRIAGELNGQMVKLVKFIGPFTWHKHDNEDEMFLVTKEVSTWSSETKQLLSMKGSSWLCLEALSIARMQHKNVR